MDEAGFNKEMVNMLTLNRTVERASEVRIESRHSILLRNGR